MTAWGLGIRLVRRIGYDFLPADVTMSSKATAWLTAAPATASAPNAPQSLSFDVPGANFESCGRVEYADFHAATGSGDYSGQWTTGIVPDGCASGPMSPQEKALEYRLSN